MNPADGKDPQNQPMQPAQPAQPVQPVEPATPTELPIDPSLVAEAVQSAEQPAVAPAEAAPVMQPAPFAPAAAPTEAAQPPVPVEQPNNPFVSPEVQPATAPAPTPFDPAAPLDPIAVSEVALPPEPPAAPEAAPVGTIFSLSDQSATPPAAAPVPAPTADATAPAAPAAFPVQTAFNPNQPIGSGSATPADKPKSNNKLIILISAIVGGLVIVGVGVWLLFMFVFNGGTIKNLAELNDAIKNQKAVNCTFRIEGAIFGEGSASYTIQADNGWNRIHIAAPELFGMEAWAIKEGDQYTTYTKALGEFQKATQDISDVQGDALFGEDELTEDMVKNLECKPNNQANFTVPDEDWVEESSSDSSVSF